MADIYAPIVRDTSISFETEPPSAQAMASRIEATLALYPFLVAHAHDAVIGYAYAGQHRARPAYRWSCDVSVYLAPSEMRRGVGRQLYAALLLTLEAQGFANAFAGIALPNAPSVLFHEALGFRAIGTFPRVGYKGGSWRDVGWWHRPLGDPASPPPEPIAFKDLGPRPAALSP